MKKEDLEFFKNLLEDRLHELLSHADSTVTGMTKPKENFADPTDRASHEAERSFELRIRDREHKLIKKIKKRLNGLKIRLLESVKCVKSLSPLNGSRLVLSPLSALTARNVKKIWKRRLVSDMPSSEIN